MPRRPTLSTLFPYTTLFRSLSKASGGKRNRFAGRSRWRRSGVASLRRSHGTPRRSEEHTSELQSRGHLVCRLLLEKKRHLRHFKIVLIAIRITLQQMRRDYI